MMARAREKAGPNPHPLPLEGRGRAASGGDNRQACYQGTVVTIGG